MNTINIRELKHNIEQRRLQIPEIRRALAQYLTVNDQNQVVVDLDYAAEASDIVAQVEQLKRESAKDGALLAKVYELVEKHDLPIIGDILDIPSIEGKANNRLAQLDHELRFAVTFGTLTTELNKRMESDIKEQKRIIKVAGLAREELLKLAN